MGPLPKLVQIPLGGVLSFRHVSQTTLDGICKLAEGTLNPTMSLIKILNSIGTMLSFRHMKDTTHC